MAREVSYGREVHPGHRQTSGHDVVGSVSPTELVRCDDAEVNPTYSDSHMMIL
jgi:hypothetical protein